MLTLAVSWLTHPLGVCVGSPQQVVRCKSYNFYSGIGSDFQEALIVVSIIGGLVALWRLYKKLRPHLECHVEECHSLGLHRVDGTNFRTCWHHHPVLSLHPRHHVPLEVIHHSHNRARDHRNNPVTQHTENQ